ncbi:hypothetical protein ACFX2A_025317 [Malus domestica]
MWRGSSDSGVIYIYICFKWSRGFVDSCHLLKLKRAGSAVYNRASSLEALVAYLYLNDMERLEVMSPSYVNFAYIVRQSACSSWQASILVNQVLLLYNGGRRFGSLIVGGRGGASGVAWWLGKG